MSEVNEINEEQQKIIDSAKTMFDGNEGVLDDSMKTNPEAPILVKDWNPMESVSNYSPQLLMPIVEQKDALVGKFLVEIYEVDYKSWVSTKGNMCKKVDFKTNVVCDERGSTAMNKRKLFIDFWLGDKVEQFNNPDGKTNTQTFIDNVSTIVNEPIMFKTEQELKDFLQTLKGKKFWAKTWHKKAKKKNLLTGSFEVDAEGKQIIEPQYNEKGYPVQKTVIWSAEFAIPVTIQQ